MNTYDEYLEEERKKLEETEKKKKDTINKGYDEQEKNTKDIYNTAVNNTEIEYESKYERNAVQKLINEKAIAEKNANLGLTDSGLNRTQQTAAQLSYANQKGALDIAKQGALDELTQNLTLSLSDIESKRATDLANLEANIEAQAQSNAIERYNADLEASVARYTGSSGGGSYSGDTHTSGYIIASESGTISRDYEGTLQDNNVDVVYNYNGDGSLKSVTYTDNNSGISRTFDAGVNPYTGDKNDDVDHGAFKNGYQPDNIGGKKLIPTTKKWYVYKGLPQTIYTLEGKYYVWDGGENVYIQLTDEQAKSAGLPTELPTVKNGRLVI